MRASKVSRGDAFSRHAARIAAPYTRVGSAVTAVKIRFPQNERWSHARGTGPVDSYFVCGTPRTGSSLLLGLLERAFGRMSYEELDVGMADATLRILDFLGLDVPDERVIAPRHERQADQLSAQWIGRYRLESAGI
jgi:hypothetical protein